MGEKKNQLVASDDDDDELSQRCGKHNLYTYDALRQWVARNDVNISLTQHKSGGRKSTSISPL